MNQRVAASIIIPTRNRAHSLARTLAALAQQTVGGETFEIVVVDNGSSDDTILVLEAGRREYPQLRLRWTQELRKGPGAARNRGLQEASGDLILFTDDDCLPEGDWAEVMIRTFSAHPEAAGVEGLTYTYVEYLSPFLHFAVNDGGVYPTCNVAYRASILRAVGGFDTSAFPDCSAEDVDLGFRVLERGPIVYQNEARVYHPPRPVGFWWQVSRGRYLVRDALTLRRRHPSRYGGVQGPSVRKRPPARTPGQPLRLTSLDVTTANTMLFRADLVRRPALYGKYVVMLALRTSYALVLLPWSLRHARRFSDAHRPMPMMAPPDH